MNVCNILTTIIFVLFSTKGWSTQKSSKNYSETDLDKTPALKANNFHRKTDIYQLLMKKKPPEIPEAVLRAIEYSMLYNVENRSPEISSMSEIKIVPIFHTYVKGGKIVFAKGYEETHFQELERRLKPDEASISDNQLVLFRGWSKVDRPKNSTLESYPDIEPILNLINFHNLKIDQRLWGIKIPSHKTHIVWDPLSPDLGYWIVKFHQSSSDSYIKSLYLDLYKDLLKENNIYFLPEVIDFQGSHNPYDFNFLIRSPHIYGINNDDQPIPLYGLIGSHLYQNWTDQQFEKWAFDNLIPAVAKTLAVMHFQLGIFPALHTQNAFAVFNHKEQKLKGIAVQDFNDTLVDGFNFLCRGETKYLKILKFSSVNNYFYDPNSAVKNPNKNAAIGRLVSTYSGQSIIYPFKSETMKKKAVIQFFKLYIAIAQNYFLDFQQYKNELAPWEVITKETSMFNPLNEHVQPIWTDQETSELIISLSKHSTAMQMIKYGMSEFHTKTRARLAPRIYPSMLEYNPTVLRTIFNAKYKSNEVVMIQEDSEHFVNSLNRFSKNLAFDGKGILLFNPNNKQVMAYAYDLEEEEIELIYQEKTLSKLKEQEKMSQKAWEDKFKVKSLSIVSCLQALIK